MNIDINYYIGETEKIIQQIPNYQTMDPNELLSMSDFIAESILAYNNDLSHDRLVHIVNYVLASIHNVECTVNVSDDDDDDDDSTTMSIDDCADELSGPMYDTYADLITHDYDYPHEKYVEKEYLDRVARIEKIKKIPQHEQKSEAWLTQRKSCLTATAVATAIDEDPYKYPAELLLDKCDKGVPFIENENTAHGNKYEEIANMYYSFRNNIIVEEYGLIQDTEYKFIGASPDGICECYQANKKDLSTIVGRLLEIKCPKRRRIQFSGKLDGDICPHYYFVQVQTQLFVMKMQECDFLQCQIGEYKSWQDFVDDSNTLIPGLSKMYGLEKGCVIQLMPRNLISTDPQLGLFRSKYIYPPKLHMTIQETQEWISLETLNYHENKYYQEYVIDRIIYWRLEKVGCNLITYNNDWFQSKIPVLKQFWSYVEFYRKHPNRLNKIETFIKKVGPHKSDLIFEKINEDYLSVHKKSNFEPLYQTESEWRKYYNKKYRRNI